MKDYTAAAVGNQLRAMGCARYMLLMRRENPGKKDRPILKGPLPPAGVMKEIRNMRRLNGQGWHVYVQPDPGEQRALVLVDDLTVSSVVQMKNLGVAPACVVETSPGSYQCWVNLGKDPMAAEERRLVARRLAGYFGGDPCSAASIHMGRLAGFTNVKEKHRGKGRGGAHPYVLCRESGGGVCAEAQNARKWAAMARASLLARKQSASAVQDPLRKHLDSAELPDIVRKIEQYCADWYRRYKTTRESGDLSRRDISAIRRLLLDGCGDEHIIQGMWPMIQEECRTGIRQMKYRSYLERTISRAKEYISAAETGPERG
ncbi:MAG: RepB family DNA primase [Desulfovibrio sp.]|nr:RepB family DNA primase [Desulfovibrio sp.]